VKQQRQRRKEEQVLPVEARELAGPKRVENGGERKKEPSLGEIQELYKNSCGLIPALQNTFP
jgi:hypothetical protein